MAGGEAVEQISLPGHRAGKVSHDRPGGVSAEAKSTGIVEFLHCPHERHVAVADQFEQRLRPADVLLGNRYHQAQVRPDDPILDDIGPHQQYLDVLEL